MTPEHTRELLELKRYSTTPFYTPGNFNGELGRSDRLVLHLTISRFGGTLPTVTVLAEDSGDGINFSEIGTVLFVSSGDMAEGTFRGALGQVYGRYLRFKITLGGTTPWVTMSLRATLLSD